MLNIGTHILHHARPEKTNAAFKMEIKAAVIHIGRADDRDRIVGYVHFGMYKAGRILIDAHARVEQYLIKGLRRLVNQPLVGNVRGDDTYITAT